MLGCFGSFNPDERKYPCTSTKQDCITGYACVAATEMRSESTQASLTVCARECGDNSVQCPDGFRCSAGARTVELDTISVCISIDEMDVVEPDSGRVADASIDAALITPLNNDVGMAFDVSFGPEDCDGTGCMDEIPDAGTVVDPDVAVVDNGCHSACTGYCNFTETQCQLPCSLDQCVSVCDASGGSGVNSILASFMGGSELCAGGAGDTIDILESDARYEELAVSCPEFCADLDAYLTDGVSGAGAVCGDHLRCDQTECVGACEEDTFQFAQNLGEITLSTSHSQCPLNGKLLSRMGASTRSISVKNICIPCDDTCDVLFPGSDGAGAGAADDFWCGIVQRNSPCPAISSKAVCTTQCALHPEQFFVFDASQICGDPSDAEAESVIANSTPLCGAQCESTNTDWGDVGSFTEVPVILIYGNAGATEPVTVERGTRICFRAQGIGSNNTQLCDLVIFINSQGFARFEVSFDPIGQGGSVSDPSQNTLKYAAKFTAHGESTVTENLFAMAIYHNFSDMLLRESIPDPGVDFDTQIYDVVTPMLNDGDIGLVSRRITADEYRMEFTFNDVQTPSALTIDHFTIGSTQDIDGSCQNQCFERSGGDFCRDLCDPDEGLMALCAQSVEMPRRADVPFTSNLNQSGQPRNAFCAQGETSGARFSKDFDADSCLRECKRNRCDLQFQLNALWHPGAANAGGRCHRLNFGGYQGWQLDENFPDERGEDVALTQLCCLCSHDYCEGILRDGATPIDCDD